MEIEGSSKRSRPSIL